MRLYIARGKLNHIFLENRAWIDESIRKTLGEIFDLFSPIRNGALITRIENDECKTLINQFTDLNLKIQDMVEQNTGVHFLEEWISKRLPNPKKLPKPVSDTLNKPCNAIDKNIRKKGHR
jgi:hypothetical protein